MKLDKAKYAIKTMAKEKGRPEAEIIYEIEDAIREAIDNAHRSGDQYAIRIWSQIPHSGKYPSALEVIEYFGGILDGIQ